MEAPAMPSVSPNLVYGPAAAAAAPAPAALGRSRHAGTASQDRAAARASDVADHPDAALLNAISLCESLERQVQETFAGPDRIETYHEQDARLARLYRQQAPLIDRICALRARTAEGVRARARLLLAMEHETSLAVAAADDPAEEHDRRMILALLRDLTTTGDA
jgi:hypothetical protein